MNRPRASLARIQREATARPSPLSPRRNRPLAWIHPKAQDTLAADDRFWDAIERDEASRPGSFAWWEEAFADAERAAAERARAEAEARARAELAERNRQPRRGRVVSDRERASAYLAKMDAGPNGLAMACLHMVRGFALGEAEGAALVEAEFVPRYHRKVKPGEVRGRARWAEKQGRMEWGEKLRDR